jgi:hypothetical protein
MTWKVEWSDVCVADVRRMSWQLATRICRSVLDYAESGAGHVERVSAADPYALRLRVPGAAARIRLDPETRTVFVWRIFAT